MDILRKYWLPVSIYLLAFYVIPTFTMGRIESGIGIAILNLILINSIAVFFGTSFITYKYGLYWVNPLIIVALYIASCFIIYNSSAIGYLALYAIVATIALGLGYLFRRNLSSRP